MKTISYADLNRQIREKFPNARVELLDANYEVIDESVVLQAHSDFRSWLAETWGIKRSEIKWVSDVFDCDKFSKAFDTYVNLRRAARHFRDGDEGHAYALGRISYNIKGKRGQGHAINVAFTAKGIKTFEPQSKGPAWVTLNEAERRSTWLVSI